VRAVELPFVTVVVPVLDDAERLHRCLVSLSQQTYPAERFEVVVVDNGSRQSPGPVVDLFSCARLEHEPRRGSYAARNRGVAAACGEVLAFTDSDCRPGTEWVQVGVGRLLAEPTTGIVAGAISIELDNAEAARPVELYELLHAFPQESYVRESHFGATANLFMRRGVWQAVGGFEERLLSCGDRYFGQRAYAAGFSIVFEPAAWVKHPPRSTWTAYRTKVARVQRGLLDILEVTGDSIATSGMPKWRMLLPPVRSVARGWSDARFTTRRQKMLYACALVQARWLYVWIAWRERSRRLAAQRRAGVNRSLA